MKRINGIQFRSGVEKAGYKIASSLGQSVRIVWTGDTCTAAIDSRGHLHLANVPDETVVSEALVWKYAGYILHELLHRKWTAFGVVSSLSDQYLRALHNGIEDAWIENRAVRDGLVGNAEELLTVLVNGMVDEALVAVKDWTDPRQYPFSFAINLRLHGKTVPVAGGHEWIVAEAQQRLALCNSTQDTADLAKWVMAQLQSNQGKGKSQGEGQGQSGQGKGQDSKDADGKGKGKDQGNGQGEGEGDGEKGSESDSKGSNAADKGEGKGQGAGEAKKPESVGSASQVGNFQKAVEVEPSLKGDGTRNGGSYSGEAGTVPIQHHVSGIKQWDLSSAASAKLRYEVKRMFENSANDEWQVNRRAGSLNVRALSKVSSTDRLFKRRLETDGVDSAVVILLDVSGSMFEQHYKVDAKGDVVRNALGGVVRFSYMEYAVKAAAALVDTLTRAGVKVSVQTFGSRVAVCKGFDEPAARGLERMTRIRGGGNTNDYEALRYAHEQLYKRPEERKAVFVLTDGMGYERATAAQVKSGEALGISTVGIGICVDVRRIYPKAIEINSADDIGNASFKQIKLAA